MNYIKHLAGFFDRVAGDERLNPSHVSMYVSLFQFWNANRFRNPISIARNELMRVSKISAKNTYHKCLKELHEYGYLRYKPSFNPLKGSLVYLFNFQSGCEQVGGRSRTKKATGAEQVAGPFINTVNFNRQENCLNDELGGTNDELRVTRDELRVTNYEWRVTSEEMWRMDAEHLFEKAGG